MPLPLVLLPGMMCDARLFAPQIAAFSSSRSITVPRLGEFDTMQDLAEQVLADAPEYFALAGLSMGGILAMEVLRQAPDRVARLALLDTNPRAELDEVKAKRGPQMQAVENGGLRDVMTGQMIPLYLADKSDPKGLHQICEDMAMDLGGQVFLNQSKALRDRPSQIETLRAYKGPSLVLCGRHDVLCPLDRHEQMHALLDNSRYEIVEEAGHLTTLEQPEQVNAALSRWLEDA